MKFFHKLIIAIFILFFPINFLSANEKAAFIDIDYIIQNSNVGKKTLNIIKDLNKKNISELEKKNKTLMELEISIKNKQNVISEDDFNNEVKIFQKKIQDFTKDKNKTVKEFNNFRKNELEKVFKLFKPIISNYMSQNSINILIDSKNVFMGSDDANLTKDMLKIINDELK